MGSMTGRSTIVTGAAQGIGRAIGEALLDEGGDVCFADLNGDGVTDILYRDNNKRRLFVSWSGMSGWNGLKKNIGRPALSKLSLIDADGDKYDDISVGINKKGITKVSYGGGTKFIKAQVLDCEQTRRLLDFEGLGYSGSVTRLC
mgnify:CR=1 FL=1